MSEPLVEVTCPCLCAPKLVRMRQEIEELKDEVQRLIRNGRGYSHFYES